MSHAVHQGVTQVSRNSFQLTRRGKLILRGIPALLIALFLITAAFLALTGIFAPSAQAATETGTVQQMTNSARKVNVYAGDSLWTVAAQVNTQRDVRDVMSDIMKLNDLKNSAVHPGQQLWIPLS